MRRWTRHLGTITSLGVLALAAPVALHGLGRDPTTMGRGEPELVPALQQYKQWTRVTRTPYQIPSRLAALCEDPTPQTIAAERAANPHAGAYVEVYVNEPGRATMSTKGDVVFPRGTVIVKEKRYDVQKAEPDLLTIMVKREDGYNPEMGDWEFAVVDGQATTVKARGRLTTCMECHKPARGTDFVFRPYAFGPD